MILLRLIWWVAKYGGIMLLGFLAWPAILGYRIIEQKVQQMDDDSIGGACILTLVAELAWIVFLSLLLTSLGG